MGIEKQPSGQENFSTKGYHHLHCVDGLLSCSDRSPLNKSVVVESCHFSLLWQFMYICIYVCVPTDMGTVLKVVTIPRESWHDLEEVVLEEMTVFRVRFPTIAHVHFSNV